LNIGGNAKTGRPGEQIVLYVFFAGCSFKLPTTEILSVFGAAIFTLVVDLA
jgi:hypothetical protein